MNERDDEAPADPPVCTAVVTIATNRSLDTDDAGETIVTTLEAREFEVVMREHVDNDHDKVQSIILRMIEREDVDAVITGGATSVEPDDVTLEAVEPLLDKELTTFSELFTALGYEEVGSRIVAARTLAGVAEGIPVFCLPGDADAARFALEEIVLPEVDHLIELAREELDEDDEDDDASEAGDADGNAGPATAADGTESAPDERANGGE